MDIFVILPISGAHVGPGQVAVIESVICTEGWNVSSDKQSCISKLTRKYQISSLHVYDPSYKKAP